MLHVAAGGMLGVRHTGSSRPAVVTILMDGAYLHSDTLEPGEQRDFDVPKGELVVRCRIEGDRPRTLERTVTIQSGKSTEIVFDTTGN